VIIFTVEQMTPQDFKKELTEQLVPFKYKCVVTKRVPESWLVLKKGSYALACIPYCEIEATDYNNSHAKRVLRKGGIGVAVYSGISPPDKPGRFRRYVRLSPIRLFATRPILGFLVTIPDHFSLSLRH
jgi:hypothetical protein